MNNVALMPCKKADLPFFFDEPLPERKEPKPYRVYHDGGHYIAIPFKRKNCSYVSVEKEPRKDIDMLFDSLYYAGQREGLKNDDLKDFIYDGIIKLFPNYPNIDEWLEKKIAREKNNYFHRLKRFKRKANLNRWTYFVTVTYNGDKHDEASFRKKLRKCLSNLHTRRSWRYMGVFEYSPEEHRLHFHALVYVPHGQMLGKITEKTDYDTRNERMRITHENSFFVEAFGRNDFEEILCSAVQNNSLIGYLTKYLGKTGERIVYSRGIASEIFIRLCDDDIAAKFINFVDMYVLFDDIVDWERDVMRFTPRQMSLWDYVCNPAFAA